MRRYLLHYSKSTLGRARALRKRMTDAEWRLWFHVRNDQLGVHFRRQAPFGRYVVDFLCIKARLAVEVDGGQHYTNEGMRRDRIRDHYLKGKGLRIIRFSNYDVIENIDGVIDEILYHLDLPPAQKAARLPKRGTHGQSKRSMETKPAGGFLDCQG